MSYVMSRIAMNDIFVAVFIVAAYLAFWQIWSGRWARSAWWVLPLVGVLLGLAAATKWVGFYALAGIWILVLARSSLGRLALVALVAFATVVGGVGAPWPFLATMLLALAIALAIVHARPIRLDLDERQAGATGDRRRHRRRGARLRDRVRPGGRRHAGQCGRGPVRPARPRRPGRLGGLADAGGRRDPHRVACVDLAARSAFRRALAATG